MKALKTIVVNAGTIGKGSDIPSDIVAELKKKVEGEKESRLDRLVRLGAIEGKSPAEKKAGRPPKAEKAE